MKLAVAIAVLVAAPAAGQTVVPLPPADLGQTNILDGEGGPGGLLEIIAAGSLAGRLVDAGGRTVPGNARQRSAALILHPIYTSRVRLLGGWLGGEVLVPMTSVGVDSGAGPLQSTTGVGDVTLAPFLQWTGGSGTSAAASAPRRWSARAGMQFVAPVGRHRVSRAVNVGGGAWQVSPYLAATVRIGRRWEASGRAIFDRSGTAVPDGAAGPQVRAGDFVILNVSASREIGSMWRIGAGGYALGQTGRSRVDGVDQGQLQRVFAAGPVARRRIGRAVLLAAAYAEFGVRERPQGFSANLRFQHPF